MKKYPYSLILIRLLTVASLIAFTSDLLAADAAPFVKENASIVFMGDSITLASDKPDGFATLIAAAIKKAQPASNVQIHIAAKGGRGIKYLASIFDSKVVPNKPDIVVILIGINDVRGSEQNTAPDPAEFEQLLKKLVIQCQDLGAKTVVCSPLIRGEKTDGSNPYDKLIGEYVAACKKVGSETSSIYIDLRSIFLERLRILNPQNAEEGHLSKDGVHPNAAGNALIANAILDAWSIPHAK